MMNPETCAHVVEIASTVRPITDVLGRVLGWRAEVRARCARCWAGFAFVGAGEGMGFDRPGVDASAMVLRAPLKPLAIEPPAAPDMAGVRVAG